MGTGRSTSGCLGRGDWLVGAGRASECMGVARAGSRWEAHRIDSIASLASGIRPIRTILLLCI